MPVSSTHCQIGSIVAVGIVENGPSSVQWSVFYKILAAWGITVPLAAAVAAPASGCVTPSTCMNVASQITEAMRQSHSLHYLGHQCLTL